MCALLVPVVHRACTALHVAAGAAAVVLGVLLLALSVARAPLGPLVDTLALRRLGPARDTIGTVRVWGTVAYNLVGIALGRLVTTGPHPLFVYPVFGAVTLLLALPLTIALAGDGCRSNSGEDDGSKDKSKNGKTKNESKNKEGTWDKLKAVLQKREMAMFLVTVLGAGYCHVVFAQYATVYMVARADTSADILSRSALAKLVGEVPVLLLGRVLAARLGARGLVALSLGGTVLRLAGLLLLRGDWLALPHALHGLTFAAFWLVMVAHATALAPPGAEATAHAVVSAAYNGAASVLCSLCSGTVAAHCGLRAVFHVALVVAVLAAIAFALSSRKQEQQQQEETKKDL